METNPRRVVAFGPFEINCLTGELRKHGIRLPLQDQPLRILAALLERPGAVVSREELCRRLWPHGTFVDFEHSLNAAVRRLRVALGDDADTPRFIETIPRRGYRFLLWGCRDPRSGMAPVRPADSALRPFPIRLAVKAFARLSSEPFDVFSEGLTEETIAQLARTCPRHVGVIARTSVSRAMRPEQRAADAGPLLGADYVLEGSIRQDGDRLRIVAQLITAHEETHLWVAAFDRVLGDALTIQTDVAEQIARGVADALVEKRTAVGF